MFNSILELNITSFSLQTIVAGTKLNYRACVLLVGLIVYASIF